MTVVMAAQAAGAWCGFAAYVLTARRLFWRLRDGHEKRTCKAHGTPEFRVGYGTRGCCMDRVTVSESLACVSAMLLALGFPLIWLAFAVMWRPRLTAEELEAERSRDLRAVALEPGKDSKSVALRERW